MTTSPAPNPDLLKHVQLLVRLHELIRAGHGDSSETDALRDQLDTCWIRLDHREKELVRDLSSDLHTLGRSTSSGEYATNGRFRLKDFGRSISLAEVVAYLTSQGWKTHPNRMLIVCEGPLDDAGLPIIAFVPADESSPDYSLRIEDLIFTLSTLEERPAIEIAKGMTEAIEHGDEEFQPLSDRVTLILERHVRRDRSEGEARLLAERIIPLLQYVELGEQSLQEAALFLAGCARILENEPESKLLLWRLSELVGVGPRIRSQDKLDEYFNLARRDNPNEPEALLEWLRQNSDRRVSEPTEEHAAIEKKAELTD